MNRVKFHSPGGLHLGMLGYLDLSKPPFPSLHSISFPHSLTSSISLPCFILRSLPFQCPALASHSLQLSSYVVTFLPYKDTRADAHIHTTLCCTYTISCLAPFLSFCLPKRPVNFVCHHRCAARTISLGMLSFSRLARACVTVPRFLNFVVSSWVL